MLGSSPRFAALKAVVKAAGIAAIIGGLVLIGLAFSSENDRIWLTAAGGLTILAGILILAGSFLLFKIEADTFRLSDRLHDLLELCKQQTELQRKIVANTVLSDAAKSLANREKECETFRASIHADLRLEKWEVARHLVDEMERRFGYAEEAETLRKEISEAQIDTMRRRLGQATSAIQALMDAHNWDKASHEVDRLHHALPDEPRVAKLRTRLNEAKAARKTELLKSWDSAVGRQDVDEAIGVLRELDAHLSREEARSLEESARDIFKAKLLQLGMQFQFAVSEKRWRDALEAGIQITEEFPNSKMAREVKVAMDGLRKRAGLEIDVEITTGDRSNRKS